MSIAKHFTARLSIISTRPVRRNHSDKWLRFYYGNDLHVHFNSDSFIKLGYRLGQHSPDANWAEPHMNNVGSMKGHCTMCLTTIESMLAGNLLVYQAPCFSLSQYNSMPDNRNPVWANLFTFPTAALAQVYGTSRTSESYLSWLASNMRIKQ